MSYKFISISTLQEDLKTNKISCKALVEQAITDIAAKKHLNAFLEVFETSAKKQAETVDAKIKSGKQGRLAGVIVGLKDNICFKDHKVSCSSKILENFESLFSATVVEKM